MARISVKELLDDLAEIAELEFLSDLRFASNIKIKFAVKIAANRSYPLNQWKAAYKYLICEESRQDNVNGVIEELLDRLGSSGR